MDKGKNKKRQSAALGRGLDSLLPSEGEKIFSVAVANLCPNPYQPRTHFDEGQLVELAESIRKHGILQPLIVRKKSVGYEIVAGERRFRAAKMAGLETVPAVVRILHEEQMMEIALIENVQRADLNPIEVAHGYRLLMENCGLKQEELAERTGMSRSHVANTLRLLQLPKEVQGYVSSGSLTMGHARAILSVRGEEKQRVLAERVMDKGISVRQLESLIQGQVAGDQRTEGVLEEKSPPLQLSSYENFFQDLWGIPVQLRYKKTKKKTGGIDIVYHSKEEIDRIVEDLKKKLS
ncbi:ParB/RepB/Spo0J family partition protein [Pasteuria penetrans]|uniref:ParB/RepB/Spo0J family partition protein n=1 Tax=Pasteuria penetrans TaxID=86005 RepID=UPI000FB70D12|nr:ParB/RepB/Spo0J family partition protein [Pasteuria penetrans]